MSYKDILSVLVTPAYLSRSFFQTFGDTADLIARRGLSPSTVTMSALAFLQRLMYFYNSGFTSSLTNWSGTAHSPLATSESSLPSRHAITLMTHKRKFYTHWIPIYQSPLFKIQIPVLPCKKDRVEVSFLFQSYFIDIALPRYLYCISPTV